MKLEQWVEEERARTGQTKRTVLQTLAERAGLAYMTLAPVAKGARLSIYNKAKAVSAATGYKVTIPELCDSEITPIVKGQFREPS